MFADLCNRAKAERVYQGLSSVEIDRHAGVVGTPKCPLKRYSLLKRFDQFTAAAVYCWCSELDHYCPVT